MRFLLAAVTLTAAFSSFAFTVSDDLGRPVHLAQTAKRIIVLSPDMVETVYAIGAGPQIVGVISGSDYPVSANAKTKVGSVSGLDLERMASLQPDLILVWGQGFLPALQPFMREGVAVYVSEPKHLVDIPVLMRRLGVLTGHVHQAALQAQAFERAVSRQRVSVHQRVRVFFELNAQPLMTVNGSDWITEVISVCGGENVFSDLPWRAAVVDAEAVIARHPALILSASSTEQNPFLLVSSVFHPVYRVIPEDLIERPGPRLVEGVARVCLALHSLNG